MNPKQIKVAQEIVDTEVSYVENLQKLEQMFRQRLTNHIKVGRQVLSRDSINMIFSNLEQIFDTNSAMCKEFVRLRFRGDEALVYGIGDILIKYVPFMKSYTAYVEQHPKAINCVSDEKEKNEKFREFLELNELCAGQTIESLMILPIQRVPRYVLLMKELLKQSKGSVFLQREDLERAVAELEQAAGGINSDIKNIEARTKIIQIQRDVFHNQIHLVAPHRYLIASGVMKKVHKKSSFGRSKKHLVLLCNDILVWAEEKTRSGYKMKHALPLALCAVEKVPDSQTPEPALRVTCIDVEAIQDVVMAAETQQSRDSWYVRIFKQIDEMRREMGTNGNLRVADLEAELVLGKPREIKLHGLGDSLNVTRVSSMSFANRKSPRSNGSGSPPAPGASGGRQAPSQSMHMMAHALHANTSSLSVSQTRERSASSISVASATSDMPRPSEPSRDSFNYTAATGTRPTSASVASCHSGAPSGRNTSTGAPGDRMRRQTMGIPPPRPPPLSSRSPVAPRPQAPSIVLSPMQQIEAAKGLQRGFSQKF